MKNFLTNVFGFIIYNSATSVFEKKIFSFFFFFFLPSMRPRSYRDLADLQTLM